MGMVNGIWFPEPDDPIDDLNGTLATMATSISAAQKVVQVNSLTQLNGMTGEAYPPGMLATLTEISNGLDRIALFLRSNNGFWMLISGARLINLGTFITAINGFSNIYTYAGVTFYDASTGLSGMWKSSTADYDIIQDQAWTPITTGQGTERPNFGYSPAYKFVPGGVVLRGTIQRVGKNWGNGERVITLPAEARPDASMRFTLTGGSWALANVQLGTEGYLTIYGIMNVNPKWLSLDGLFIPQGD